MQKIGILGSGIVAKTLGTGFIRKKYQVMLGSRDTRKLDDWKVSAGENVFTGNFQEAAKFGDILVLAVAGHAAVEAIRQAGPENLVGKVVIDTTNPIAPGEPKNGVISYFTQSGESLMELLQNEFPEIRFVKAFNSVGNAFMVDPEFKEGKPTMFICGNDSDAKNQVAEILNAFSWEAEDMGTVSSAEAIESLCILWCLPGFLRNQWTHAFKLLKS